MDVLMLCEEKSPGSEDHFKPKKIMKVSSIFDGEFNIKSMDKLTNEESTITCDNKIIHIY